MNKLGIIVPYRDRQEHLKKFVPHMKNFLQNKVDYKIIFVEQTFSKTFNRGMLRNIGFEFLKEECEYFCMHDIDMLPINNDCDYSFNNGVTKLSRFISQFNFIPRPDNELGGVFLIDKESFLAINGYSNDYWGWGVEDDDILLRCKNKNINIVQRNGRYMSLYHKPNGDTYGDKPSQETINNRKLFSEIKNSNEALYKSGLSNLKYDVLSIEVKADYILAKVEI
jgi:predicted glycosyltransferase involved in capsule biosynthesis